eukprot:231075_1
MDDIKHNDNEEEKKESEKRAYHLISNPLITASHSNLPSLKPLKPSKALSWLEKDVHIAILQANPIESDDGGLSLRFEIKRLQDIFFRTTRGLKIFFGVLTKGSLIRCIQRGA